MIFRLGLVDIRVRACPIKSLVKIPDNLDDDLSVPTEPSAVRFTLFRMRIESSIAYYFGLDHRVLLQHGVKVLT